MSIEYRGIQRPGPFWHMLTIDQRSKNCYSGKHHPSSYNPIVRSAVRLKVPGKKGIMSKQAEAELILKLYDLRRDATMRQARDWYFRHFQPETMADVNAVLYGDHSAHLRMVTSYWEMAAALVNHGAISIDLFTDTNGEHISVFAKLEPLIPEIRAAYGPQFFASLEKLIDATPNGRERSAQMRERMKAIRAQLESQQTQAARQ